MLLRNAGTALVLARRRDLGEELAAASVLLALGSAAAVSTAAVLVLRRPRRPRPLSCVSVPRCDAGGGYPNRGMRGTPLIRCRGPPTRASVKAE
ncbi:hypothetical protein ACFWWT_46620 [Streptomyces sp. NPDC058676]|uniref:hypothetical protein n=1 Tax=unclassified Streptomyces TaxID=2593676 RepID=UPI00365DF7B5